MRGDIAERIIWHRGGAGRACALVFVGLLLLELRALVFVRASVFGFSLARGCDAGRVCGSGVMVSLLSVSSEV